MNGKSNEGLDMRQPTNTRRVTQNQPHFNAEITARLRNSFLSYDILME